VRLGVGNVDLSKSTHLQIYGNRIQFKGALCLNGIRNIAADLGIETADCNVHMGVFRQCIGKFLQVCPLHCSRLGKRVCAYSPGKFSSQTSHASYLEDRVERHIPGVTVLGRTTDMVSFLPNAS
jgi:hypothetical protein